WEYEDGRWIPHPIGDEPFDHNCQAVHMFQGELYVSTLEDGLIVRTPSGWGRVGRESLSSMSPRQMVELDGKLYVRHGNGKLDRFDGNRWEPDVGANLPGKPLTALATDDERRNAGES